MPTVKQSVEIAITIAVAFVAATAFGISAVEQTAPQVTTAITRLQRRISGSMIISDSENLWALSGP
jgi:hypothetical protein